MTRALMAGALMAGGLHDEGLHGGGPHGGGLHAGNKFALMDCYTYLIINKSKLNIDNSIWLARQTTIEIICKLDNK
jgi:hypothetical protein